MFIIMAFFTLAVITMTFFAMIINIKGFYNRIYLKGIVKMKFIIMTFIKIAFSYDSVF